ncbi:hypothetical protein LOK49_LG01G03075 [Camellia lanceoleosa]|uniref:Uncharacterized protein n=1 Tax=Camellia lanceoleosa TaxID=1840588 RepID=A0ACC0J1Y9_9ERIC|nr:hypothetical protein LOK49_LG01G03075 [Camellia lanceoleosa]
MAIESVGLNELDSLELEEGSDESIDTSHLCLIGKILAHKPLNTQAVQRILSGAWKTRASVNISAWPDNVFLFSFGNLDDRALILQQTPWSIMGNLLIGKLIGVEAPSDGLLLARSFLRLRVEINVTAPLPKGFMLKRQTAHSLELKDTWVEFKYERLSDFCYDCGRIGHEKSSCKFVLREEGQTSGYGPGLRTGVAKNLGLSVAYYQDQIDEMEAQLRPFLRQPYSPILKEGNTVHVNQATNQSRTTTVGAPCSPPPLCLESKPTVIHDHSTCGAHIGKTTTLVSTPSLFQSFEPSLSLNVPFLHTPLTSSFGSINTPSPSPPSQSSPYRLGMPPSPTHSGLPYFATEPSDSPTSQDHSRSLLSTQNDLQTQSGPNSPSKPTSELLALDLAEAPESLLSSVFTGLSLKRKALDEPPQFLTPTQIPQTGASVQD